jgi:hypothetical protein
MDTEEILKQLSKTGVTSDELAGLLENEVSLKERIRKISGLEKVIKNTEFVREFKDFMTAEENAKRIFKLIKTKTTIKQVFVYPKKEHLEILEKIDSVVKVDEETKSKLIPTSGEVCVVEKGNPKSESWQNLDWEKNGLLIKIAGIVGPNGCFYPFERPTNGIVSLKIILDGDYRVNCIGDSTHFDKLHDIYSLIIGKIIIPGYRIKPIFFYDIRPAKCEREMQDYIKLWYNIFKNKKSKEIHGYEIPNSDAKVEEIISMIKENSYGSGDWNGKMTDYIWLSDNATRNLAAVSSTYTLGSPRQKRGSTVNREKVKNYNIWRCE